jgi:hypothetical protein
MAEGLAHEPVSESVAHEPVSESVAHEPIVKQASAPEYAIEASNTILWRKATGAIKAGVISGLAFVVVMGVIEIGRRLIVINRLNDAAAVACRAGILEQQNKVGIRKVAETALKSAGIRSDVADIRVSETFDDPLTPRETEEVTVVVRVPVSAVSWVPDVKFLRGTLQGQYTLRRE